MGKNFVKICKYMINVIAILIISILLLMSIFNTSYIDIGEKTTFGKDNWGLNIICILGVTTIVVALQHFKKKIKINKYVLIGITGLLAAILIAFLIKAHFYPSADQWSVCNTARNLHNQKFIDMEKGEYLFMYPNQIGIITIIYYLGYIFGYEDYIYVQFINVIALISAFIIIYKMCKILFDRYKSEERAKITYISYIIFIPLILYVTFIYGNILGFFLSILAIYLELLYIKNKHIKNIIAAIILMALAVIVKSNYLISMIAMIILLFLNMLEDKKIKNIIFIGAILIVYVLSNIVLKANIKRITNIELNDGAPMISWVAMGLQESREPDYRASGWFNWYNYNIYKDNDYNTEIAKKESINDIKESLKNFAKNPKQLYKFFIEKTESQWNEPTFQSIWIMKYMKQNANQSYILSDEINEDRIFNYYIKIFDIIHTLILFGALLYFILNFKNNNIYELIFIIIFIGGFLFHLFWEAKSQYTVTYFVLLIPYCINGFADLCRIWDRSQ